MTGKERARLKSQAANLDCIFQIGKEGLTPQLAVAIRQALDARELIKINILKNCADDPKELSNLIAERTGSQVVGLVGRKLVLYKENTKKTGQTNRKKRSYDEKNRHTRRHV